MGQNGKQKNNKCSRAKEEEGEKKKISKKTNKPKKGGEKVSENNLSLKPPS